MLHFNGLEPIDFKGKLYTPRIDEEKRLRLQTAKFETSEQIAEARNLVCECFDETEAKDFIRTKLSPDDVQLIAIYLTRGETGVNNFARLTDGAIDKVVERKMTEAEND